MSFLEHVSHLLSAASTLSSSTTSAVFSEAWLPSDVLELELVEVFEARMPSDNPDSELRGASEAMLPSDVQSVLLFAISFESNIYIPLTGQIANYSPAFR